jgi:hypothetical protein
MPAYSATEAVTPLVVTKPKMKNGELIAYVPEILEDVSNFHELGISNVSNFSMVVSGKNSLNGTDLMTAYGSNNEIWEDSVKRDKNLYNKFNDKTDIKSKSESLVQERRVEAPLDPKIKEHEAKLALAQLTQDKLRQIKQSDSDRFYASINRLAIDRPF